MDPLAFARQVCSEAGSLLLLRRREGALGRVDQKASATDLVTAVDREAEEHVVRRIRERFPDHAILSEESGEVGGNSTSHRWILDPLDGTRNYVYGFPFYSVSLALVVGGRTEVGVVEVPYLRESFWARRGGGAFLNGERIHVSERQRFDDALFSTGFACVRAGLKRNNIPPTARILDRTHDIRRTGSAAMDLCYVACGRLDGFWELALAPWDVAAGGLIVEEAGGRATDFSDGPNWLFGREMVATNGSLHRSLLAEVLDAWGERL